jgi:hypothetical protein
VSLLPPFAQSYRNRYISSSHWPDTNLRVLGFIVLDWQGFLPSINIQVDETFHGQVTLLSLQYSLRFLRFNLALLVLCTTTHRTMDQVNGSFVPHRLLKAWSAEPEDRSWNLDLRNAIVFSKSLLLDLTELFYSHSRRSVLPTLLALHLS